MENAKTVSSLAESFSATISSDSDQSSTRSSGLVFEIDKDKQKEPNARYIEDYDVFAPFIWRTDSQHSCQDPNNPDTDQIFQVTHSISPARVDFVSKEQPVFEGAEASPLPNTNDEICKYVPRKQKSKPVDENDTSYWLLGGPLGSRNSLLVFRSSALAHPSESSVQSKPAFKLHITYKVSQAETKLLSKLLDCHGVTEVETFSSDFNLLWTGSHPKPGILRAMAPHQRVNHFPRSYELTRKDRLYKNIEKMQHARGFKHFDIVPQTFVMPGEFRDLCSTHYRIKGPWIVKPVASSRGRGIFIVENPNQVPLDEPVVVAKYINKPLLVEGHKCDLRLYVLVTSMDPLIVYIYEEGLVRLATVRYDASHKQLWNPCMHLCNYSINKYHSDYVKSDDPSAENVGHKWTLSALLRHLKAQSKDTALLMAQIEDVVVKAMIATAPTIVPACQMFIPFTNNCFELYGFDILIDENLKPWLLEVNLSPSLCCDSPLDVRLKSAMLSDLLTLVGIPAVDPMLRSSTSSVTTPSNSSMRGSSALKMKLSNCRRVYSADGLNNASKKNSHGGPFSKSNLVMTAEEVKMVRCAKAQFDRRGGFVRIFPTVDSWSKYSQYLDSTTGVPTCGAPTSSYSLLVPRNFNQILFMQLFPEIPLTVSVKTNEKLTSAEKKLIDHKKAVPLDGGEKGATQNRQDRYERMLSQGHRAALTPKKIPLKTTHSMELKNQVVEVLKSGGKLSQAEARKTFSQYLGFVLKRIASAPEHEGHVEIVLKFLQKASTYLRSPFNINIPSHQLLYKDRAAIVAKQLNEFLCLYNRETETYSHILERPSQLPNNLFVQFLEHAHECDLEEVLMYQSFDNEPKQSKVQNSYQGLLKCLPNAMNSNCLKIPGGGRKNTMKVSNVL